MDRLTKYSEECRALADECGGLDRLRELAEADRDGRLVVLPAKTVFELTWDAGPDCDLICVRAARIVRRAATIRQSAPSGRNIRRPKPRSRATSHRSRSEKI